MGRGFPAPKDDVGVSGGGGVFVGHFPGGQGDDDVGPTAEDHFDGHEQADHPKTRYGPMDQD